MIRVQCPKPSCHNHTEVNEVFIGRPVRCKKCGTSFVIQKPVPVVKPAPRPIAPAPLAALSEAPALSAVSTPSPPVLETPPIEEELEVAEVEIMEDDFVVPVLNEDDIPMMAADEDGMGTESPFHFVIADTVTEGSAAEMALTMAAVVPEAVSAEDETEEPEAEPPTPRQSGRRKA